MQPAFPTKKVILVVALIVFLIIGYELYAYFNFSVSATDPKIGQVYNWSPFFDVSFNQQLSSKNLSLSLSPNILYGKYSVSGNTLFIPLSVPMQTNKSYQITINSITDTHGQTLRNLSFSFKPTNKNISQLPENQKEELTRRNALSPVYKDPILQHLPFRSLDFDLTATFPTGKNNLPSLVLVAKLFVPAADTGSLQQQVVAQRQQEVQGFIMSHGLNPNNYTIDYVVGNGS